MLRRILAGLTSPPPLRALQLEARIAWERFDEGDPEPLDTFIKNRLGIMSNFAGSLPREVRSRVMKFLDGCFATVPLYQPGDWFLLGPPQLDQLTELVGENIKGFPDLKIALSGDGRTFRETLLEELPGVTRVAWEDIQRIKKETLLTRVSESLRMMKPISAKIAELSPKTVCKISEDYSDIGAHHGAFSSGNMDSDMAEFEAREEARQQAAALPKLVEEAALPASERTVFEFDSQIGIDFATREEATQAAAEHMGIARSTVRTYRERYRNKLATIQSLTSG